MSDFWYSTEIQHTRKPHHCEYCGAVIPVGSHCDKEVGVYDGDFNSYYLCDRCVLFIKNFVDRANFDDELGELTDDIVDTDLFKCPQCGSGSYDDWEYINNVQQIQVECGVCGYRYTVDISYEGLQKLIKDRGGS